MKTKYSLLFAVVIAACSLQSCGGNDAEKQDSVEVAEDRNETNKVVPEDLSEFMVKAASGGMMEVQLGEMSQSKGQHQRVKDFGAMMIKDHSAANTELKALAANKNVSLPSTLGEDHQKHVTNLQEKSGKDFDKDYIDMMVSDHKDDIDAFEKAEKSEDADLKAFAAKTLPTLRAHLDSAKAIQDALK